MPTTLTRVTRVFSITLLLTSFLIWLTGSWLKAVEAAPLNAVSGDVVISEFRTRGPDGGFDEYIELLNRTTSPIDIGGWQIWGSNGDTLPDTSSRRTIPSGTTLQGGQRYLITNTQGYSGSVAGDLTYSTGITDNGGIALTLADGVTIIDQVGMSVNSAYVEGAYLDPLSGTSDQSYERNGNGCIDSDDNSTDFVLSSPSSPQNSTSIPLACLRVINVSSTTDNGEYTTNAVIAVTIQFSSNVNVTGTPQLQLETGLNDGYATYGSGSGTDTLTFNYNVQNGDASADLDYVATNSLSLNGGTIMGAVGDASLVLPNPGGPNSLSANKNIVLNNMVAPYVVSFARQSTARITNATSIVFRVTFNEPVIGADTLPSPNFLIHNNSPEPTTSAVVTGITRINSNVYDVTVSGGDLNSFNGVVGLDLSPTPTIIDTVSTPIIVGEPSVDEDYLVDHIAPAVTIDQAVGQADPASGPPVNFTVVFSEPIDTNQFTHEDIVQTGISPSLVTWSITDLGDHQTFTLSAATVAGNGILQPSIPAGRVKDLAGNDNTASTTNGDDSVAFSDTIPPSVTVNQSAGQSDYTNVLPIHFTVVFSEPIVANIFTTSDITQTGTASGVTWTITDSGDHKVFTLSATAVNSAGTVAPFIDANRVIDFVGNNNLASTSTDNVVVYDTTAPTVTVNQAAGQRDPATSLPIRFTVIFSEGINVSTFTVEDITQSGTAVVSAWSITDSGDHSTFTLSALSLSKNGTVTPSIAAGKITDLTGNSNKASTSTDNTVTAPSVVPSFTPTPSRTRTPTRTITPTGTRRTATPSPTPTLGVVISEIAWMGTKASSSDEWIELYNRGSAAVDLSGWTLKSTDGTINILFTSSDPDHTIASGEYFILARAGTFESVVINKNISDSISNDGRALELRNASGILIDTANANGGAWPAGVASPSYYTMERHLLNFRDMSANWYTFGGTPTEKDADGNWIYGTPGYANWAAGVTATPSRTPSPTRTPTRKGAVIVTPSTTLVINEFMPRAGFDWNQDGRVDVFDEFIEIANLGPLDINLNGWKLDDAAGQGSSPYTIPSKTLKVGERIVFYASQTNILLSDGGDTVRLMNPNNVVKDAQTYSVIKVADQSWCRLPDINGSWFMDCFPTPNQRNSRTGEVPNAPPDTGLETPLCLLPDTLPEDFRNAECYGFGSNMWQAMYWDLAGWFKEFIVPQGASKWDTFVE